MDTPRPPPEVVLSIEERAKLEERKRAARHEAKTLRREERKQAVVQETIPSDETITPQ